MKRTPTNSFTMPGMTHQKAKATKKLTNKGPSKSLQSTPVPIVDEHKVD